MKLPQIIITVVLILLIIYGLISIFSPKTTWWLSIGWQLRNTEPTEKALIANRIGGAFMVVFSIVLIYLVTNNIL